VPVKDRTEAFDRLVREPGAPCRSHEDPAVAPSLQQATRGRRVTRHQDRQDQVVAQKERQTEGPSPFFPRLAMEDLLIAPLWPRDVFGKMPQTCRVAYRSLLIGLLWDFVNVDAEQPEAETAHARAYGNVHMLTHAVACRLYPGEVGAGYMAADAAALRERIVQVKRSRLPLVTLWQCHSRPVSRF
jgi:hypothetical protein